QIGCGFPGMPATVANVDACNKSFGVAGACVAANPPKASCPVSSPGTPNTLFANPAYPTGATPFERFGTLGRNIFHGPRFVDLRSGAAFRACLPPSPMLTLATNHLELPAPVLLRIPPKPRALCPHREHQTRSSLIQPIRLELRRSNVLAL